MFRSKEALTDLVFEISELNMELGMTWDDYDKQMELLGKLHLKSKELKWFLVRARVFMVIDGR